MRGNGIVSRTCSSPQIQATAREVAAQAVGAERRVSIEEWEQKFSVAREQLAQQVSAAVAKIQEESDTRSRAAHNAVAEALQRELPRWIAPQLEELTRALTQQISDRGAAERTEQTQHFASAVESLRALCQQAEESAARLHAQTQETEIQIANRAADSIHEVDEVARQREVAANAHREAMSEAANETRQQAMASLSAAQSSWQTHLDNEVKTAHELWHSTVESTLATAQEKATTGLDEYIHTRVSQMQEESGRQTASAREAIAGTAAENSRTPRAT